MKVQTQQSLKKVTKVIQKVKSSFQYKKIQKPKQTQKQPEEKKPGILDNLLKYQALFKKAEELYKAEEKKMHDFYKQGKDKDIDYYLTLLKKGTFGDKTSALSLLIGKNPAMSLNFIS